MSGSYALRWQGPRMVATCKRCGEQSRGSDYTKWVIEHSLKHDREDHT